VRSVSGRERVANKYIAEFGELLSEFRIVFLLSWVESKVLKEKNLPIFQVIREFSYFRPNTVWCHDNVGVEQLGETTADWRERKGRLSSRGFT